jgi:hypothetical protein
MDGPPKELANLRMIAADLCGKAILRRFRILEVKWLQEGSAVWLRGTDTVIF